MEVQQVQRWQNNQLILAMSVSSGGDNFSLARPNGERFVVRSPHHFPADPNHRVEKHPAASLLVHPVAQPYNQPKPRSTQFISRSL